ncbi:aromatic amino acid ammonia-lyase [Hymenobacter sp. GOD-10R]|uniref:HAL/PAL/TAL family ammonia-lyase n=1 Tax=Hymenobacter sp. GOD-10R TaxID=3093922 RepID=UPI002D77A783|nr:aromatic amino acid ammonia-lyase [Hymenobacter sp. GOD-10R]WRQ26555.1 aromatic amino acid ammonia-lyase [Hymenobacter sp. GOD-10R]
MTDFALHPTTRLDLPTLNALLTDQRRVVLSPEAKQQLEAGAAYARAQFADDSQTPASQLLAHACGMGEEVPTDLVRLMLMLKAQSLSYGHSGAQVATVQRLLDFYNREMLPVVYQQGSLGAGDQVPLAHLCLPLLGLGEVNFQGYRLQTADAMHLFSWPAVELAPGEHLALLTGTQFMLAYGVQALLRAQRLAQAADVIGALSYHVFGGDLVPFDARIHALRPHAGQTLVAERLRSLLADSVASPQPSSTEQLPYSFRCLPQVHGASRDALGYVAQVLEAECNSVTAGLAVFPHDEAILLSGNFHGQPLALALDFMALATAELGSISERRTAQLLSKQLGPSTMAESPSLLAPQYTAASLANQNKQFCSPASLDNAGTVGVADHVSMGANAALKARRVLENTEQVLAIELYTAAQALSSRRPVRTSSALEQIVAALAAKVDVETPSKAPYLALQATAAFVRTYAWQ